MIFAIGGYFIVKQIVNHPTSESVIESPVLYKSNAEDHSYTNGNENAVQDNFDSFIPIIDQIDTNFSNFLNGLNDVVLNPSNSSELKIEEAIIMKTVKCERVGNSGIYSLPEGYKFDKLQTVLLNGDPVSKSRYQVIETNDEIDIFDSKLGDKREIVIVGLGE